MPVPWEALIPFGLVTTMFGVAGTLLGLAKRSANEGKPPRWGLDAWDERLMERDSRITGTRRGQWVDPNPPSQFPRNPTIFATWNSR